MTDGNGRRRRTFYDFRAPKIYISNVETKTQSNRECLSWRIIHNSVIQGVFKFESIFEKPQIWMDSGSRRMVAD